MSAVTLSTNRRSPKLVLHETPRYAPPKLRILCATDLSSRSEAAVTRTLRMAHALNAECMLLHVVADDIALRLAGRRAERAHNALHWQARHLASLRVEPKVSVRVGHPYRTIARAASEWGAHLIVMGRQRKRSLPSARSTSAAWVSNRVGRPVLIVNSVAEREYSAVMFAGANVIGPYVQLVDQLALLDAARVSVVPQLAFKDRAALALSRVLGATPSKLADELQRRVQSRTQRWIEEAGLHLTGFEIVPRPNTPRALLARLTKQASPQLLVVPASRVPLLGQSLASSSAALALRTAACDVLIASENSVRAALVNLDLQSPLQSKDAAVKEVAMA